MGNLTKARDVLVEEVVDQHSHPVVEPVSVHQQDFLQKPELGEGEVSSPDSRPALLAHDTEADVGLLDHGDVVAAVPDGGGDGAARGAPHQLDQLALLQRGQAAAHHGRAAGTQLENKDKCIS